MSDQKNSMLVFSLDEQEFALPYAIVNRVLPALEISKVPNANEGMLGLINIQGDLIPVIDIRFYLGLPTHTLNIYDHLILIQHHKSIIAFVVQEILFADFSTSDIHSSKMLLNNIPCINNIIRTQDNIIYILDFDAILVACHFDNVNVKMQGKSFSEARGVK